MRVLPMNKVLCLVLVVGLPACFWSSSPSTGGATGPGVTDPAQEDAGGKSAEPAKLVFVTRATFAGNLGGLAGADAKCGTSASAAGISGTFVAYLSTTAVDAALRVTGNGPWNDLKGHRLFDAGAARWAGFPKLSIRTDETGDDSVNEAFRYWTGSEAQGTRSASTCGSWTLASGIALGTSGYKLANDHQWISESDRDCSEKLSILCVQND